MGWKNAQGKPHGAVCPMSLQISRVTDQVFEFRLLKVLFAHKKRHFH